MLQQLSSSWLVSVQGFQAVTALEQLHSVHYDITTTVDLGVLFIHLPSHKFPSWTPGLAL